MADFSALLSHITALDARHVEPDLVPACPGFPLPKMYAGQGRAITELRQYQSAVLKSPTGSGKTATFLTLTPGIPTMIIEPRKFLQKQVASYRGDAIIFGRSEYPCHYAANAGSAPCLRKIRCDRTDHAKECEYATKECAKKPCQIFRRRVYKDGEDYTYDDRPDTGYSFVFQRYPCASCKYLDAVATAKGVIKHGGTIICNFANFYQFLNDAELIIVDEADLFFKEISSSKLIRSCKDPNMDISRMLTNEITSVNQQMQTCTQMQYYGFRNDLYRLNFLLDVADLCFTYKKKEKVYVEINPANVNLLKEHLFAGKRVIIVSATPGEFALPAVDYSIHQRCGIFFVPQGKLTARELKRQPWLLDNAGTFIDQMSSIFDGIYGSKKFVVHCANVGYHATHIRDQLDELASRNLKKGELPKSVCTLHEKGNLMGTMEKFLESDTRYLLIASGEYGADLSWCNCQFIVKFPYASLDDRMRALERKVGKDAFDKFYTVDAISRFVQCCGRVGRGWDSFGATFVLDSKALEVYNRYSNAFPAWFKSRLIPEVF